MTSGSTYARLRSLQTPLITTGEAAAALRMSASATSRALRNLERQGLLLHIRYGLWSLEPKPTDPRRLASEITRPYPAYISFESALSAHGMIDQLPRDITVASVDRAKTVKTRLGTFAVHHLPPELFGGFDSKDGLPLATPEKALFDYYYIAGASLKRRRRLPEVELPHAFSERRLLSWLARIESSRLRREVGASLDHALASATRT